MTAGGPNEYGDDSPTNRFKDPATGEAYFVIVDKKTGKTTGKITYNAKGTLYRAYNPKKDKMPAFKDSKSGKLYSSIYARVIIKNKK